MGMDSQDLWWQKENMENKGFYGKELGVSDSCFESIDCADLSDRAILAQMNRNSAGPRERKSPNCGGLDFGSFSYEDHLKNQRSDAYLMGLERQSDLGSNCKSNFSSNHSKARTSQGVESGFKLDRVTSEEKLGPAYNSKLEVGGRPLSHVASGGSLNELEYELEFGSRLAERLVSPKSRTSRTPKMVSDFSGTKRCRCVCELGSGSRETQIHQSPNHSLYFSPYENPGSHKTKPPNRPRMDSLSQRRQCFCDIPKCRNLQEDYTAKLLSNEHERKVNCGNKKGDSGLSRICKVFVVLMLLVIIFLTVPMKYRAFFGPDKLSIGVQINSFLNPVDLGSNHGEDVNLERQIELSKVDLRSNQGEDMNMERQIEPYAVDLSSNSSEDVNFEKQNEPYIDEGELEKNIKLLAAGTEIGLIEEGVETLEEHNFTEIPIEENGGSKELQSKSEDEFKYENVKQCGESDFVVGELEEGPLTIPIEQTGYVALVQTDTDDRIEDMKMEMRIRFCVAFISVLFCASLVSCIIRRKQFGEMVERYCSVNKGENISKKNAKKDDPVLHDCTYGSIVAYEKIPTKKRGGNTNGILTPVRRSTRIRKNLASPS